MNRNDPAPGMMPDGQLNVVARLCEAWMPPYVGPGVDPDNEYAKWRQCQNRSSSTRDGHVVCGHHARSKNIHWGAP